MSATILVTSAGSGVGLALLDSLDGRREGLRLVGINSHAESPHLNRYDHAYVVAPVANEGFPRDLSRVLARTRPDLVLAGRDDDVVTLAVLAEEGIIPRELLASGGAHLARTLRDTGLTAAWAQARGLPFCPTVTLGLPDSLEALENAIDSHPGSWIVKKRLSSGSIGVEVVHEPARLVLLASYTGYVVQPFLDSLPVGEEVMPWSWDDQGWEADAQIVIAPGGSIIGAAGFATHLVRGTPQAVERLADELLQDVACAFGTALAAEGWRGPLNIQARLSLDGQWLPFEINPRLGGGSFLRARAGFDEAGLLLDAFLGVGLTPLRAP